MAACQATPSGRPIHETIFNNEVPTTRTDHVATLLSSTVGYHPTLGANKLRKCCGWVTAFDGDLFEQEGKPAFSRETLDRQSEGLKVESHGICDAHRELISQTDIYQPTSFLG